MPVWIYSSANGGSPSADTVSPVYSYFESTCDGIDILPAFSRAPFSISRGRLAVVSNVVAFLSLTHWYSFE